MSNLKDTDIDDLIRRASDKYPLRTDSANWDRMAAALENKGPEPPDGPIAPEEKRKRRFLWLFLLLPLAGAGYYTWHHAGNTGKANNAGTSVNAVASHNPTSTATSTPTIGTAANTSTPTPAAGQTITPAAGQNRPAAPTVANLNRTSPGAAATPAAAAAGTTPATERVATARTATARHATARAAAARHATADATTPDATAPGIDQNSTGQNSTGRNSTSQNSMNSLTAGTSQTGDRLFYDLQRAPISRDYRLSINVTAPPAKKDPVAKPNNTAKLKDKTKHFYAGIFGSPDLSTVKMQSVKGVGTTFGVILGYTFKGGRWAVETGAYLDRKKYYTEGEYFSTKEINLPANSWLTDVNGICYMWEIPVNARYNFNPGARTSWFATAGLSTYLMTREKYNYGLEWPGSTRPYDSNRSFDKPSQYPFSIINLSAGFEQRLGKVGNLRVEPYVRLPLTGLGTGKLPIVSAGVNIGITRQLW